MIPLVFFSFFGKLKWMKIHTHTVVAIKSTFFVVVTLEFHITAFMGQLISYQLQLQWGAGSGMEMEGYLSLETKVYILCKLKFYL